MCIASAQNIIPETLVEEMAEPDVGITRECFEKTCEFEECRLAKIACAPQSASPWLVLVSPKKEKRLVPAKTVEKHAPGLVDVTMHSKQINPNKAISMPGVPRTAPPALIRAMKQQDAVLKKIRKMEEKQFKMDPLHKKARGNWLKLAAAVVHMAPSPDKLKSELAVLHLARELAKQEQKEHAQGVTTPEQQEASAPQQEGTPTTADKTGISSLPEGAKKKFLKKLVTTVVAKWEKAHAKDTIVSKEQAAAQIMPLLKKIVEHMGLLPKPQASQQAKTPQKTLHGLPVSNRKCVERACVRYDVKADGTKFCGAAVISCGDRNGDEPPAAMKTKMSKKDALSMTKRNFAKALAGAVKGTSQEVDPSALVSEGLDENEIF
jgi:hypothetical protein